VKISFANIHHKLKLPNKSYLGATAHSVKTLDKTTLGIIINNTGLNITTLGISKLITTPSY
jgi:hypothetical protein